MSNAEGVSPLDAHLGFWLRFVSNHVSHAFKLKVEEHGVTVAEWVVLRQLFETGATPPSRLAENLSMTRGAISKLVERLAAKKLAERREAEGDRRFQSVELTDHGRTLVPTLAKLADRNDAEFFGHLDPEQRAALRGLLEGIVGRLGLENLPVE